MGYIIYEGPSRLDNKPIMVVITPQTRNVKTGPLAQVWILRSDVDPATAAYTTGEDRSVCGNCIHRPSKLGTCYVNVWQAPARVFQAAQNGRYNRLTTASQRQRLSRQVGAIRLGAYGDPAAVPLHVWRELLACTKEWTGYTHQWRGLVDPEWRELLMASVDDPQEAEEARAAGWRTFRVRTKDQPLLAGEFVCPATAEAPVSDTPRTCSTCMACNGRRPDRENQAHPVIFVHGSRARKFDVAAAR